ncbi:MAG: hypothetical protein HMLKMBBP_02692 [Planctomycetes bacterium]|nr:hypothetical protein [Planctomycetota bacterium]
MRKEHVRGPGLLVGLPLRCASHDVVGGRRVVAERVDRLRALVEEVVLGRGRLPAGVDRRDDVAVAVVVAGRDLIGAAAPGLALDLVHEPALVVDRARLAVASGDLLRRPVRIVVDLRRPLGRARHVLADHERLVHLVVGGRRFPPRGRGERRPVVVDVLDAPLRDVEVLVVLELGHVAERGRRLDLRHVPVALDGVERGVAVRVLHALHVAPGLVVVLGRQVEPALVHDDLLDAPLPGARGPVLVLRDLPLAVGPRVEGAV